LGPVTTSERVHDLRVLGTSLGPDAIDMVLVPTPATESRGSDGDSGNDPKPVVPQPGLDLLPLLFFRQILFHATIPRLRAAQGRQRCFDPLGKLINRALGLTRLLPQRFHSHYTSRELVVADDQRKGGGTPVRPTKLCLEIATTEVHLEAAPRQLIAQPLYERKAPGRRSLAIQDHVDVGFAGAGNCPACISRATMRSMPIAKPIAGVASPPSCAISPS